ncbi:MAG: hypothetical protein BMS9Abin33_1018 [Gammaproteobacteria bacterium]|nr:MAG: hypothetical protein BMS9Abin33_1018 [Gammaproteobacteria bacterium]
MKLNQSLDSVTSTLHGIMGLGMSLAVTFLVVDLLFPGTTNIVNNVAVLVNSFIGHGLVGLIALLVFISLYSGK